MLTQDQIDEWIDGQAPAIDAARKYAERARKGLPPDRFAQGTDGARMVAKGIEALGMLIALQSDIIQALTQAQIEAGRQSMGLGRNG